MSEQTAGEGREELTRERAETIIQNMDLGSLSYQQIASLFRREPEIISSAPEGVYRVDPRNREHILYSAARKRRPYDPRPDGPVAVGRYDPRGTCAICRGETTGVVDFKELSEGFTFINKNLFPMLLPSDEGEVMPEVTPNDPPPGDRGLPARGLHFLQWTSSVHKNDWHNMPIDDLSQVMERLASLERQLLTTNDVMPSTRAWGDQTGRSGFVSIIKNGGHLAGGSISHGHQQIAFGNVMPRSTHEHWAYAQDHGEPLSSFLLRENPSELTVRDYGPAVLIVPYFMRRPYDMMLIVKNTRRSYLFELDRDEISTISEGWQDAIRALRYVMPLLGREVAYNVVTHNGPGAGLYFSFLPKTQETGGFEQLGLSICQSTPNEAANELKTQTLRSALG